MTPQVGQTIQWRRATGKGVQMVVDLIHEVDGERWLFGKVHANGSWTAVNQKYVLGRTA